MANQQLWAKHGEGPYITRYKRHRSCAGASRNHFDWGGVFIELPEYAIFIKLPEFYWMS